MSNTNIEALRKRLGSNIKREVTILRQVIYKEVQMWKRTVWEKLDGENPKNTSHNEVTHKLAFLSEVDKQFIDTQIEWFIMGDIPDNLIEVYAKSVLKDLAQTTSMTTAQQGLYKDLKEALDGKTIKEKTEEALKADDLPF